MGWKDIKKKKRWFSILTNIYILILTVFVVWMIFFDTNSLLIHMELKKGDQQIGKAEGVFKR